VRYDVRPAASGGWLALAAGPRLLVLPDLDDPASALAALAGADGFRRAVDLLAAGGLTAMPAFVLVDTSGEARIIVRGEVGVTIEDAAGARVIDASTVSTWVEQVVPGLLTVTVRVPGASDAIARDLPIDGGVALVAAVRAGVDALGSTSPAIDVDPTSPIVAAVATSPGGHDVDPTPPISAAVATSPGGHDVDPHATVVGLFLGDGAAPEVAAGDAAPLDADTAADVGAGAGEDGYDYLFGETVFRSVAEAAVPEPGEEPRDAASGAAAAPAGDHDGETVLTSDIAKLRGDRPRTAPAATAPPPAIVPSVILPNGSRERLEQPIIVGRSPSASQVTAGSIPKLITLGSGDQDISRNHVRLALEGGTVVVTDLHSVNGTSVVLPGREPQRLRAGDSTAVIPGTIVDLGGGVTLTVVED